jgi:hypothetical protein
MSPKDNNKQVSAAVRILQQKRDASARATHLMVKNDSLITYEKEFPGQAAVKKFFAATFLERKKMSTKTITKRIALVAVAALTLGGFSAVSANAAADATTPFYVTAADAGVQASSAADTTQSASGVAGPFNYVEITAGADLASGEVLGVSATGVNGALSVPTPPTGRTDTLTVTGNTIASQANLINGAKVRILTPTAGTFAVTINKNVTNTSTGAVTTTKLQTFNFTVTAASVVGAFSAANSFTVLRETATAAITTNSQNLAAYETTTVPVTVSTASSTVGDTKGTLGTNTAEKLIVVRLMDTQATPAALTNKTITAVVTGVGLIAGQPLYLGDSITAWSTPQPSAVSKTNAAGWALFAVYSHGVAGTGKVEISYTDAAGVKNIIGEESLLFTGDLATLTATPGSTVLRAGGGTTGAATDTGYAVQLVGRDSANNIIDLSGVSIAATSSKASVIASVVAANGYTGAAAGTANANVRNATVAAASTAVSGDAATLTFSHTNAAGTVISSAAVPFTVGGITASGVAISFDKTEYAIGDLVTVTLTVTDSGSRPVADGTYFLFDTTSAGAFATSAQLTTAPFGTGSVAVKGGKATATFYAPYTTGDVQIAATVNSEHSTVTSTYRGTKLATSMAVGGSDATASLALDAANAATDAANNAYDEAQNATQAASDALAAVTALAKQVKSLIASVKKLTAAVAKLR